MGYLNEAGMRVMVEKLRMLKAGSRVTYHTGCLVSDRKKNGAVGTVASEARRLSDDKRVLLTQKRIDLNTFDYIAIGLK